MEYLPIWNFKKVQSANDLRYILKVEDYSTLPKLNLIQFKKLGELWDKFDTEYLGEIGITPEQKMFILQRKRLLELQLKAFVNEDDYLDGVYQVQKAQFDAKYPEKEDDTKFYDELALLEKHFGITIDDKICSTTKYFSYVNRMKQDFQMVKNMSHNG